MGLFSGQYFKLLKVVPQNNLTPMRSCPGDARLVKFDPGVLRNFNAFTFYIKIIYHILWVLLGRIDIMTKVKSKHPDVSRLPL